jgi:hypothetical protein
MKTGFRDLSNNLPGTAVLSAGTSFDFVDSYPTFTFDISRNFTEQNYIIDLSGTIFGSNIFNFGEVDEPGIINRNYTQTRQTPGQANYQITSPNNTIWLRSKKSTNGFTDNSGNQIMTYVPANTQNKKFKIIFPTYFEKSGTYSLLVQGTDRSGNLSGDLEYKISFEVIHESMISQMMNYPNPFSTTSVLSFSNPSHLNLDLVVIDMLGQEVQTIKNITTDYMELNRSNLKNGVYFVELRNQQVLIAKGKVIVE